MAVKILVDSTFDFTVQQPRTGEATVYYEAMPGEETLCHMPAMMGSEDFANYAAKIPAVFGFLGCCAGKAQHEKQHQRSLYHALLFHDFFHLYALMTSRFHIDLKRC